MCRKWGAFAVMLCLCLVLTGCAGRARDRDIRREAGIGTGSVDEIAGTPEKYSYTMCIPHGDRLAEDRRYQFLLERFNIELEFLNVSEGDWDQKIKAWVSAGDLPDITAWNMSYHLFNQYRDYVKRGIIKAIPQLSHSYQNLQKIRDEMAADDIFQIDGKLYIWLSYNDNAQYDNLSDQMFFYRKDWAKELGVDREAYTFDEVLEMAKAFIALNPGGNKNETIGMGCGTDAFPDVMGMRFISPCWDRYFRRDNTYFWGPSLPETLQAVQTAKMMYDEGLFWREQPFANAKDAENRFVKGEMGMYWTDWSMECINDIRSKMIKVNPELNADDIAPLAIIDKNGRTFMQKSPDYGMGTFFNAAMSDEKQERILQMWDWLAGEDGMRFVSMGIKGRDWDVKAGKPVLYWDRLEDGTMTDPYKSGSSQWFWKVVRFNRSFYYDYPYYPGHVVKASREIQDYKLGRKGLLDIKELDIITPVLDSPLLRRQRNVGDNPRTQLLNIILESDDAEEDWMMWIEEQTPLAEEVVREYEYRYGKYKNK